MVEAFGISEVGLFIASPLHEQRAGSAGRAHPDWEVAVLDEDGLPVPDGQAGEIVCRPRLPGLMMRGYLNQSDRTVEATRDLWYHTGDIGRRDAEGYFWFLDRAKERIRRRGENISSMEIEQCARGHADVADVAALAHPAHAGEDDIRLLIVAQPGCASSPDGPARLAADPPAEAHGAALHRDRFEPSLHGNQQDREVPPDGGRADFKAHGMPNGRPCMARNPANQACIVGIGASRFGRRLPDSQLRLAATAFKAALADSGLRRDDVDGLSINIGSPGALDYDRIAEGFGLEIRYVNQSLVARPVRDPFAAACRPRGRGRVGGRGRLRHCRLLHAPTGHGR